VLCFAVLRCLVQNIKKKYPVVLSRINQLIGRLQVLGPEASIDVDQAALRVTLDVIGLVSYAELCFVAATTVVVGCLKQP
jgi:uncharacterized protein YlxP (DUF503 family)